MSVGVRGRANAVGPCGDDAGTGEAPPRAVVPAIVNKFQTVGPQERNAGL